mgnify:CR=1 FL=1
MCGIAGFWGGHNVSQTIAERMAESLRSRGPDDSGVWLDTSADLALAHARLSILDPSAAGRQPMVSPCGRYVLTYNGEIYNHLDLRERLESHGGAFNWRGRSDTETLLAALRHWGVPDTLNLLNGMFAFALWDSTERRLTLARDRIGEKPLYYGRSGGVFMFASELKAMMKHPSWNSTLDRNALALYLRHSYVPTPWSIFNGIKKLEPAHFIVIREGGHQVEEPQRYWDPADAMSQLPGVYEPDPQVYITELELLLRDSVAKRMVADVTVGAFLSGGIDSSLIASVMQSVSTNPIKTFSIGFHDSRFDESVYARSISHHLKTDHTELYVTPEDALEVIPRIPAIFDEPFADSSQIPTFLLSQLARKHVKVSLSGDGGDELFYGYSRYFLADKSWRWTNRLAPRMRRILAAILGNLPAATASAAMLQTRKMYPISRALDRASKLAALIAQPSGVKAYQMMISHSLLPEELVIGAELPNTIFDQETQLAHLPSLREQMLFLDLQTYLPDDILTKVDRTSMAVGLEARIPLLDYRLVEFALALPTKIKTFDGGGKWALRQVLYRHVPRELVDRPKRGFGIPLEQWIDGPLRDWAENLLSEDNLKRGGFLHPKPVRTMWQEHKSGVRRWHYQLWDVLMFQAWSDEWL